MISLYPDCICLRDQLKLHVLYRVSPQHCFLLPLGGGLWNIWYFCFSILEYNRATTIVGYSCSRPQKVSVRTSWTQILISETWRQQRRVRAHMHIFRPHIHSFHGSMPQINNTYIIFHLKRFPLFISTGCSTGSLQTLVPCGAGWWAQSPNLASVCLSAERGSRFSRKSITFQGTDTHPRVCGQHKLCVMGQNKQTKDRKLGG